MTNPVRCDCGDVWLELGSVRTIGRVEHSHTACYDLPAPEIDPPINKGKPSMDFTTYVRKPFVVEAVEITVANIGSIAKFVGDLREKEDGSPYILVDPRLVPNIERVYPGFFMTKMGENIRCYSRRIFKDQFMVQDEQIKPWVDYMMGDRSAA